MPSIDIHGASPGNSSGASSGAAPAKNTLQKMRDASYDAAEKQRDSSDTKTASMWRQVTADRRAVVAEEKKLLNDQIRAFNQQQAATKRTQGVLARAEK